MESPWSKYRRLRRNPTISVVRRDWLENEEVMYWIMVLSIALIGVMMIGILILSSI